MKVIFAHGFLGSALNWLPVLSKLRSQSDLTGYEFESLDLLGHGLRAKESFGRSITVADMGQDLLSKISNEKQVVAVGHSFGIRPWLWVAQKRPELLKALVVEDSSPVVSESGFANLKPIFDAVKPPFKSREAAKEAIEKTFGQATVMSRFLMTNIVESGGLHSWRFDAAALFGLLKNAYENPQWAEWNSYPGPVVMIMGRKSNYVPPSVIDEAVLGRMPKSTKLNWIEGAGHWVHADQLDQFVQVLKKELIALNR
jgi:esterase